MAVSQDARNHQYLEIALNEFRLNAHVAMENLAIARKRLEADIAQTAFENQMAINQLTGGGSRIDTANKFKVTDPETGNEVWVNAQDYARIMATRLEVEAANRIFTPTERFAIQAEINKTKYMDPKTKAMYAQHGFDVSGVKETPYGNASYGSTGSWDLGTESFNLQNTSTVPKVGTDIHNYLSDPIMFLPGF